MGPKIASEKLIWKAWWAEVGQGSAMTAPGRTVDKLCVGQSVDFSCWASLGLSQSRSHCGQHAATCTREPECQSRPCHGPQDITLRLQLLFFLLENGAIQSGHHS